MKVYVLETGCYDGRGIHGIYASAEAAMTAWHPNPPDPSPFTSPKVVHDMTTGNVQTVYSTAADRHSYAWEHADAGYWYFDADWDDAAAITEREVET